MPYTLAALPPTTPECCPCQPETLKFDPLGTASSAITAVSDTVSTIKTVAIGTAVAIGFLVVWNVFVK